MRRTRTRDRVRVRVRVRVSVGSGLGLGLGVGLGVGSGLGLGWLRLTPKLEVVARLGGPIALEERAQVLALGLDLSGRTVRQAVEGVDLVGVGERAHLDAPMHGNQLTQDHPIFAGRAAREAQKVTLLAIMSTSSPSL